MKYETYWLSVQVRLLVNDVVNRRGIRCPCCGEQKHIEYEEWMLKDGNIRMRCQTCKRDGRYQEFRKK